MPREPLHEIATMFDLTNLADAAFYLDEEGNLEAFLPLHRPRPPGTRAGISQSTWRASHQYRAHLRAVPAPALELTPAEIRWLNLEE